MVNRTGQSAFRRFFASRIFLVVVILALLAVAFGYARAYYQDYRVRQEINQLQEEAGKLEKKKLESMEILKYVTSPEFIEEKARTELNLKKPNEQVIILNGQEDFVGVSSTKPAVDEKPLSNMAKWWYYFIHKTP